MPAHTTDHQLSKGIPASKRINAPKEDIKKENEIEEEHLTKSGHPDRRYMENRALPPEEESSTGTPAQTGGTASDGTHITKSGSPDKRFQENKNLSEEEIREKQIEVLQEKKMG